MISEDILENYNVRIENYDSNDIIFLEGQDARNYYQLKSGEVKMYNLHEAGKEFIQGVFEKGESFGEPPLFADIKYPASASATKKTQLFILSKSEFLKLLKDHFQIHLQFTSTLSKRMSYKAMILKEMSMYSPEHRILTLVDFLKEQDKELSTYQVDLTRQQLANLTGLRVETVIRACKQLEMDGELEIINRKLHR